jgi:hypothetical protein
MPLNKKHYKNCNYRQDIDHREKIVIALSVLTEASELACEYPDVRNKEHYQESEEFYTVKDFLKATLDQS